MREHLHGRNITHRVGSVLYSHEKHLHGRNITHRVGSVLYSHEGHNIAHRVGSVLYSHEETLTWPQHNTQSGVGVVLT